MRGVRVYICVREEVIMYVRYCYMAAQVLRHRNA